MIRQSKFITTAGLLSAVMAIGWLVAFGSIGPANADKSEATQLDGTNILDGLTFSSDIGPIGKPANVKDMLVFANGAFLSTECERRCNYPARPYFVRHVGDKTEFFSETRCPDKDAKIQWRGIVDDEVIKGEFTWTVNRWYWTVEKKFWFEGTLAGRSTPIANR